MSDLLLETERLFLRPPAAEDAPAHSEMMADPLTAQFLTFDGKPQDRVIAWRTWATLSGHWNFRGFGFFSMIDKESGRWAGRAGPWYPEGWPQIEIGWGVHPDFRGRGLALEAAIAVICIEDGLIPGCLGVARVDPAFTTDIAVDNRAARVVRGLSNSFGFGGSNGALVIGRIP